MNTYKNPNLIEGLRKTMEKVERTPGVKPDDPALVELKRILSRRVAALEHRLAVGRLTGATAAGENEYESCHEPESSLTT